MPEPSLTKLNVGGIPLEIYGLDNVSTPKVAVLFVMHGRTQDMSAMTSFCRTVWSKSLGGKKDLIVVNLDQRNHGARLIDPLQNENLRTADGKTNPTHALDMYSIYTGTARDISLLIDFLPTYLFPSSFSSSSSSSSPPPYTISTWAVTGFSLGGHATWQALRSEPRLSIGVPYAGCPDFLAMMEARIAAQGVGELQVGLRGLVAREGPMGCDWQSDEPGRNPYLGRKIMVVAGSKDTLVPYEPYTRQFMEKLVVGVDGAKETLLLEGAGHEMRPLGDEKIGEFICKWACS